MQFGAFYFWEGGVVHKSGFWILKFDIRQTKIPMEMKFIWNMYIEKTSRDYHFSSHKSRSQVNLLFVVDKQGCNQREARRALLASILVRPPAKSASWSKFCLLWGMQNLCLSTKFIWLIFFLDKTPLPPFDQLRGISVAWVSNSDHFHDLIMFKFWSTDFRDCYVK